MNRRAIIFGVKGYQLTKKEKRLLKNDTNNIIVYKNDLEEFKNKRKKRFWEKLISNKNE